MAGGREILNFGGGNGTIWMDEVRCVGSEMNMSQCTFRGWGIHNCIHAEDVGVHCQRDGWMQYDGLESALGRYGHSAVWDPYNDSMIIFGGVAPNRCDALNDLWKYSWSREQTVRHNQDFWWCECESISISTGFADHCLYGVS